MSRHSGPRFYMLASSHTQSEIERDVLCAGKTVINSRGGQRMKTNIRSYTLVYDKYTTVCVSLAVI